MRKVRKEKFGVSINIDLKKQMYEYCEKNNIQLSKFVEMLLDDFFKNEELQNINTVIEKIDDLTKKINLISKDIGNNLNLTNTLCVYSEIFNCIEVENEKSLAYKESKNIINAKINNYKQNKNFRG